MQAAKPNWFAVVSKPRQEKTALRHLQRQGFRCFLPMAENPYQRRSKKRQKIVEPLFPRYLFLNAIADQTGGEPVEPRKASVTLRTVAAGK